MPRGYGRLTVLLALVAGFAIGSNPRLTPFEWLDRLRGNATLDSPPKTHKLPRTAKPLKTVSSDLKTLETAEAELFSGDTALPLPTPAYPNLAAADPSKNGVDFLYGLAQPDLPVTRDPRVARYLQFFTQTDQGRSICIEALIARLDVRSDQCFF